MTPKDSSFTEALKSDVLAGRLPELNDGDRSRYQAEQEAAEQQRKADLERAVDAQIEKMKKAGTW